MASLARKPCIRVCVIFISGVQEEDYRSSSSQLATAQPAIQNRETTTAPHRVMRPAERRCDALVPARKGFCPLGPGAMRETIRNPSSQFDDLFGERELSNHHRSIWNIVEDSLEVDTRRIVVEAHHPTARATPEKRTLTRDRGGQRTTNDSDSHGRIG